MVKKFVSCVGLGFLFLAFAVPSRASAEEYSCKIFVQGSKRQKLLYTCKSADEVAGNVLKNTVTYYNPEGKVSTIAEAIFENGKLKKFSLTQNDVNERGSVEIAQDKAVFSYTREGETKTNDEKYPENFALSANLHQTLLSHWDELMDGKDVSVRWASLDRRETVGFKFFKVQDTTVDGKEAVVIKMKPTSFVIAALVDPLFFTYSKDGKRTLEIVGRIVPKALVDGKSKDVDADLVFE
jgi:hypothetical protein